MKRLAIYGTGTSAEALLREDSNMAELTCFYETVPSRSTWLGLQVRSISEVDLELDEIIIASMFYPEMLRNLLERGFPLENVRIVAAHKDDPRFGLYWIDPVGVYADLGRYRSFQIVIRSVEDFVNSKCPLKFNDRREHLKTSFLNAPKLGVSMEFGVYHGESLLYLASLSRYPVWGFDSFSGGREGSVWAKERVEVSANTIKIPEALAGYRYLEVGYFQETIHRWLDENPDKNIAFVHYDAGDFDAANAVLKAIRRRLLSGAIMVFDELIPSPTELRASEYDALNLNFDVEEYEVVSQCASSVSIRIL